MLRGEKLGEGTFGIVYAATSPTSKQEYAIKRNLVEEETSFIGVPREVDILNKLRNHPHIVKLEKVAFGNPFKGTVFSPLIGEDRNSQRDDRIHFIFKSAEYDLHRYIYGATITDWALTKRYMVHILLGVEFMHAKRIIHRDLKPSNILIFGSESDVLNQNNIAKICDFGLAKPYTYQGIQTPNTVTSWYRAPEITLNYPHYDYKVDTWSLGCILFEMVAKRCFLNNSPDDDNDEILSSILGALPKELPVRRFRELIRLNKWRKPRLRPIHNPKTRKTFLEQLGFNRSGKRLFERQTGDLTVFCDLLDKMLTFEWDQRCTVTDALNHKFFDEYRVLIDNTRTEYPLQPLREYPYEIKACVERKWMASSATEIFNNRHALQWYSHRVLFQAMDLFDRYLSVMFRVTEIPKHALESNLKGFIHDKYGADLRFMTCIYLSIKYFSSIHYPISYDSIVAPTFRTKEAKLIADQFESSFIKNCLEYDIYQNTIYESADLFNDKLEETDIRNLIILYATNDSFKGQTPTSLYTYYRTTLRTQGLDALTKPIPNSNST